MLLLIPVLRISMTMMIRLLGAPLPVLLIRLIPTIRRILVTKMMTVLRKHVTPLDRNLMGGKGFSIGRQCYRKKIIHQPFQKNLIIYIVFVISKNSGPLNLQWEMVISWLMCHLLLVVHHLLSLLVPHSKIFHMQVLCTSLIQCYSIIPIKNLILMMRKQSCLLWWNLLMPLMDVNWFNTELIKLSPVTRKGVGPSFVLIGRWWETLMKVIFVLILIEWSMLLIRMLKGQSQKSPSKVHFSFVYWCLYEFIDSTNSFIFCCVRMWFFLL